MSATLRRLLWTALLLIPCWACPAQVTNGTFATWSGTPPQATSWINTAEASSYAQVSGQFARGGNGYSARVLPTATYGGLRQQNVPVTGNTLYRLSAWIMGGNIGGDDDVRLMAVDYGSGGPFFHTAFTSSQGWISDEAYKEYVVEFYTAPGTTSVEIQIGAGQDPAGNALAFYVDDVTLTAVTNTGYGNGDFELWSGTTPQARKWTTTAEAATYSRTSTYHSTGYAASVTPSVAYAGIRQVSIPVAGDTQYKVTAWMKGGNTGNNDVVRLMAVDYGSGGPYFTIDSTASQGGLSDSLWKAFTLTFTTRPDTTSIELQFGAYQDPTSNPITFLIDDVTLDVASNKNAIMYYNNLLAERKYTLAAGHGVGSNAQLLADTTGDGWDDAVVFFGSGGGWYVATSWGNGFATYSQWKSGLGSTSGTPLLGDVNNDGKKDACFFSGGTWTVALSSGSGFGANTTWKTGAGSGSKRQFLADVNADGYADAVYVTTTNGWVVGLSTGSGFGTFTTWRSSHSTGADNFFLADATGDGRADAITYDKDAASGTWKVAISSGTAFGTVTTWKTGFGSGSTLQTMGDYDKNGLMDAIIYTNGSWQTCQSSGSAFTTTGNWFSGHRTRVNIPAPTSIHVGKVDGLDPFAVWYGNGDWMGMKNRSYWNTTENGPAWNTWEAWASYYWPTDNPSGTQERYDVLEIPTVDYHIKQIHDAGFNVIGLDMTNGAGYEWYMKRIDTVVARIVAWNNSIPAGGHKMQFYVSGGGQQFNLTNPAIFESECQTIWNRWAAPFAYHYYQVGGKPLVINMINPADRSNWTSWAGPHPYADLFTVRWFAGCIYENSNHVNDYGWGVNNAPAGAEVMACNPGWNNQGASGDTPVSRGTDGATFRTQWLDILTNSPASMQLQSYNDFMEDTGIQPAYDSRGQWTDHYGTVMHSFYYLMAKQYCFLYRYNALFVGSYLQEYGDAAIYKVTATGWEYQGTYPAMAPVLLVPTGFRAGFAGKRI